MNELEMNLASAAGSQMVPAGFAEKAMASLMQLHTELVAEKERRVELYRTLMEKEQSLAELAMYVRVLEERLGQLQPPAAVHAQHWPASVFPGSPPAPAASARAPAPQPAPAPSASKPPEPRTAEHKASELKIPPAARTPAQAEGWKVW